MGDIPILGQPATPDGPPATPDAAPRIPVNVMTRGVQSPDPALGRICIALTLGLGLTEATIVMPIETARVLGPLITKNLEETIRNVERILSGVILPSDLPPDQAAQLFNGGHPGGR